MFILAGLCEVVGVIGIKRVAEKNNWTNNIILIAGFVKLSTAGSSDGDDTSGNDLCCLDGDRDGRSGHRRSEIDRVVYIFSIWHL